MAAIDSFTFYRLRNEEVLGFCLEEEDKISKVPMVADLLPHRVFQEALNNYKVTLNKDREVVYGDVLDSDTQMDQVLNGFRGQLKYMLKHPVQNVREAARAVWNAISQFKSPANLPPTEEHSVVSRMLDALDALPQETKDCCLATGWIDALHARHSEFMAILERYDAARRVSSQARPKDERETLTKAWQNLCSSINGLALISPSAELDNLITELNLRIRSRRIATRIRKGSKKEDGSPTEDSTCSTASISEEVD